MKKLILVMSILCANIFASADSIGLIDRNEHGRDPIGRIDDRNDRDRDPFGGGRIDASRRYCDRELCDYDLEWSVRGNSSVVVLEVIGGPENGAVKLLGCSSSTGRSDIPWIRRDGARYVFHLFDSSRCTRDVIRYERPVDSVTIQEGRDDNGGGDGRYGNIDGRRQNCYSDLCEYNISWNVNGNASVVTVVDQQTGREKLFACGSSSGQQMAPWIPRNGTNVEFRLYASSTCSADVGRVSRPVDTLVIRER